ncbi:MAG: PIG-L deacetylase family protein [Candidatus Sulfotelmatobacter sp.]
MNAEDDRCRVELEGFFLSRAEQANTPRTLLIAAHPDDETIGAGALLRRRPNIKVIHVTDGSPLNPGDALAAGFATRADYAEARRKETVQALAHAGIREDAITNLQFTDQQLSFQLKEVTERVLAVVRQFQPEVVLTHAYEGGHPDHDSVAFACQMARRAASFCLCEFAGYHAGCAGMEIHTFLPRAQQTQYTYRLNSDEREFKIAMIKKFATQERTLQPFTQPEVERFRVAPEYDFTRPPHDGKLWYENFNWGTEGATWRKMASQTLSEILHP